LDYKFAIVNHTTLHISKFMSRDELSDAVISFKHKDIEFTALRYYENIKRWVAFDKWE